MSRAMDPAMHAPGFQLAHCLPPAGVGRPKDLDMYRFHRVVPLYTPDPCIGPSQGQLICPPDCGYQKRNDVMPPAGVPRLPDGDSFQFYDTRRDAPKPKRACACPAFANNQPCASLGPITDPLNCPCINRQTNEGLWKAPAAPLVIPQAQQQLLHHQQQQQQQYHHYHHQQQQQPQQPTHPHGPPSSNYGGGIYDYYVNNAPLDRTTLTKIPLCDNSRDGAVAPTPHMMKFGPEDGSRRSKYGGGGGGEGGGGGLQSGKVINLGGTGSCAAYHCQNPYIPSGYLCRPVFDRKYLDDCPEQNGPHPDHYTFLCNYKFQARPWELEDRHPGCLQPQCGSNPRCKQCRQHTAKGHIWNCPGNDPNVGPKMAMFLKCNDDDESLLPPYYFGGC